MKILFGIQGTGNGHLTRALEILPFLQEKADVDVLISGEQFDLPLPFEPKYRMKGLDFVFGKNGGINMLETFKRIDSFRFLKEVRNFPVEKYDLVISDFEPISCWSAHIRKKTCIGLSNQSATLHPDAPRPKKADPLGKLILQYYAPVTINFGFHFKKLSDTIFTPVIRQEVRKLIPTIENHFTVYLPSYNDDRIIENLKEFPAQNWEVFSKHNSTPVTLNNIRIQPIQGKEFLQSISTSKGVLCNAGFGTTSEALFMGKKLLVIPMKGQYEQHCNAAMLKSMGSVVIKSLKRKHHNKISDWIKNGKPVKVDFPDQTAKIVDSLLKFA